LIFQFNERFNQFRRLEKTLKFIKYPDVSNFEELELCEFAWLKLEDFEMELIDFKNSIWTQIFIELRSKIEEMEINRLRNEVRISYESEIVKTWNRLPDSYNNLKKLANAVLTIFSSTYFCETLFSDLKNIKSNKRNRLTDEVSAACLLLKNTEFKPELEILAEKLSKKK
jgi:hypothetical protein